MSFATTIPVFDAIKALAFIGDLSMGQPIDHSTRTAWVASQLSAALGADEAAQADAVCVSLLRWSGCTANAPEFSALLGDDVGGRRAMLATVSAEAASRFASSVGPLAQIHCDVSVEIARALGMAETVERPLRNIFESFDGNGKPAGLRASDIPSAVFLVSIAGDFEVLSRTYGLHDAIKSISERAGRRYPGAIVEALVQRASSFLDALEQGAADQLLPPTAELEKAEVGLELVADVIDLKLPWMTGYSRKIAAMAADCAAGMGLGQEVAQQIYRAALIHGMGRASVPNRVWDVAMPGEADREQLRLVPYWTGRATRRIEALQREGELASMIDERMDGSGCFRGLKGASIDMAGRILAAAAHWVSLLTDRPGRPAVPQAGAVEAMGREVDSGRLDAAAVAHLTGALRQDSPGDTAFTLLSRREIEVLRHISLGESNKEAARSLGISPSTVRTHLENVFRKLGCNTRAAATLKASTLSLL